MNTSFWLPSEAEAPADSYAAFRGRFHLPMEGEVELRVTGASWYQASLDGTPLLEGPPRYALEQPEYQTRRVTLPAGEHLLAFHAHHHGVDTRLLRVTPPFVWCEVRQDGELVSVSWRGAELRGPWRGFRRTSPQLGWVEWRDTRKDPLGWEQPGFDDSGWSAVRFGASALPAPRPCDLGEVGTLPHVLSACAAGPLAHRFGYTTDDPSAGFHLRDRVCRELPPEGVWRRYDLGRVRLGRASFRLKLPPGAVVEIALSEELVDGRACPYIPLSTGYSCNLDHFVARGGEQVFQPLEPKGGRFLEIHILGDVGRDCFIEETFLERTYHEPAEGRFSSGDPLLDRIWTVGVETYRACAEDVLIDCPTRERGEWIGDARIPLEIAAVSYHDLRLFPRVLRHAAVCARADGLVAGLAPGGCAYLPTHSMFWCALGAQYLRLTGDRAPLEELWPAALRNMEAMHAHWRDDEGLRNVPGWNFVDWGYAREEPVDLACNLLYLHALQSMRSWAAALGRGAEAPFTVRAERSASWLRAQIAARRARGGWPALGYHVASLSLMVGLVAPGEEQACLDYLAAHMRECFPNDRSAPRHADPRTPITRVITPYFAHHVLPLFAERGRMDFVLEQIRTCWGYLLENDRTTWMEVFDPRWSHCHAWSGCPTWILSRYVLGLHPRLDLGADRFDFRLAAGSLPCASGRMPHPSGGWIEIAWELSGDRRRVHLRTDRPLTLHFSSGEARLVRDVLDFEVALAEPTKTEKT